MNDIYNNTYLFFDEAQHKYTDNIGNEYISVTTIIGNYVEKFDAEYWARKKAKEQNVSVKEIYKQWGKIKDEACARGSKTHNNIEDAIKDTSMFKQAIRYLQQTESGRCITVADIPEMIPTPLDVNKFIKATNNKYEEIYRVFDFYISQGYTIYSEICVFDPYLLISGTIDILCYKPTDFVILDWKTNRDGLQFESGYYKKDKNVIPNQLTNEWIRTNKTMLPPLNHLPECNGSHYTLQLSSYARLVQRMLRLPCKGLGLCHIASPFVLNSYGQPLRDNDGYHVDPNGKETVTWHRIPFLSKEVDAIFNDRIIYVKSMKNKKDTQLHLDL